MPCTYSQMLLFVELALEFWGPLDDINVQYIKLESLSEAIVETMAGRNLKSQSPPKGKPYAHEL